jgi:hypothetical protein
VTITLNIIKYSLKCYELQNLWLIFKILISINRYFIILKSKFVATAGGKTIGMAGLPAAAEESSPLATTGLETAPTRHHHMPLKRNHPNKEIPQTLYREIQSVSELLTETI